MLLSLADNNWWLPLPPPCRLVGSCPHTISSPGFPIQCFITAHWRRPYKSANTTISKKVCFHCIGIKGQFRAREFSKVEDPSEHPTHFQQQLGRVPLRTQSQSQVSRFVFPHCSLQCLSGKHYSACRSSKTIVFLTTVPDICSLVRRSHFWQPGDQASQYSVWGGKKQPQRFVFHRKPQWWLPDFPSSKY